MRMLPTHTEERTIVHDLRDQLAAEKVKHAVLLGTVRRPPTCIAASTQASAPTLEREQARAVDAGQHCVDAWRSLEQSERRDVAPLYAASATDRALIEAETRDQAESDVWHRLRHGRVTASTAYGFTRARDPAAYAQGIMHPRDIGQLPAVAYGHDNESHALAAYSFEKLERSEELVRPGLMLHPEHGWFGASADSLVYRNDGAGGRQLVNAVEVKCPYSARDVTTLDDLLRVPAVAAYIRGNDGRCKCREWYILTRTDTFPSSILDSLNEHHANFWQCQCIMEVYNLRTMDFVVYAPRMPQEVLVLRVPRVSPARWERFFLTVQLRAHGHLFPLVAEEIATGVVVGRDE